MRRAWRPWETGALRSIHCKRGPPIRNMNKSRAAKDDPTMRAQAIPFVDTNIIPDKNAGIGSLLLDLQDSQGPDPDGPPLLGPEFAFIDVGASRAKVATTLKTRLER